MVKKLNEKYDPKYGKGTTQLFGLELLDFISGEVYDEDLIIPMEIKLIHAFKKLNAWYHRDSFAIEQDKELCEKFWNFYRVGIGFLAQFLGYINPKIDTREELTFYLMEYLVNGICNPEFVPDTFNCMILVKGDLERMSNQ